MRAIILLITTLLLLSCSSSKTKVVEEQKVERVEKVDSVGARVKETIKDTVKETGEWEWEWCPEDSTSTEPVEISKGDLKIKIPKKGVLRHKKKVELTSILEREKDSATVKKTTDTKTYDYKRSKDVERETEGSWFWWIIIVILVIIFLIIRQIKK